MRVSAPWTLLLSLLTQTQVNQRHCGMHPIDTQVFDLPYQLPLELQQPHPQAEMQSPLDQLHYLLPLSLLLQLAFVSRHSVVQLSLQIQHCQPCHSQAHVHQQQTSHSLWLLPELGFVELSSLPHLLLPVKPKTQLLIHQGKTHIHQLFSESKLKPESSHSNNA